MDRHKKSVKPVVIYVVIALIAVIALIIIALCVKGNKKSENTENSSSIISSVIEESSAVESETSDEATSLETSSELIESKEEKVVSKEVSKEVSQEKVSSVIQTVNDDGWYLRIASLSSPMPDSWRPTNLTTIDSAGRQIDSRIYEAYKKMTSDAAAAGLNLYPISAFRPKSTQETLFNNRKNRSRNEHPDYTEEQVYQDAAKNVAPSGTSDHELGLAVDFNSVETSFANTDEGKWLAAHCSDYGFVLRYPADKTDITGVNYEPWHFRYVTVEHAKKMEELDMVLEEYVKYLEQ